MTRIVHLITGLGVGGAELSLYRLLANLTAGERRHHQVISMIPLDVVADKISALNVSVTSLGMAPGRISVNGLVRLLVRLWHTRNWRLHAWMYHANLLATLAALLFLRPRRVIWSVRNSLTHLHQEKKMTQLVIRVGAWLSFLPACILYVAQRSAAQHEAVGYSRARTRVLASGYDVSAFVPDPAARTRLHAQLGVDAAIPLIGVVGRWDWTKDHANFLAALACVPQAQAVLIGKGMESSNQELTQIIAQQGVGERVHLLGRRDDLPQVVPGLDILCLSSVSESMPNVVGEAMACGVPCVVTDVGDAAHLVGETGWVVPPQDSTALAKALDTALQAPDRPVRGQAARARILEHFSLSRMVESYRQLYKELGWM